MTDVRGRENAQDLSQLRGCRGDLQGDAYVLRGEDLPRTGGDLDAGHIDGFVRNSNPC